MNPFTAPFWEAAAEGRLVVQVCGQCGERQWSPQFACRSCLSEDVGWLQCSGGATVYSLTVVHRSPDPARWPPPYVLGVVQLDEGPHLLARLDVDVRAPLPIGRRVRVAFQAGGDGDPAPVVYVFRPE